MQDEIKGVGRPRKHDDQEFALDNYNARLLARQARKVRRIGSGNLSEGIRMVIDSYDESARLQSGIELQKPLI